MSSQQYSCALLWLLSYGLGSWRAGAVRDVTDVVRNVSSARRQRAAAPFRRAQPSDPPFQAARVNVNYRPPSTRGPRTLLIKKK